MSDEHRGLWPAQDAPGLYEARCSCGAKREGTPKEIADWGRTHDDSPSWKHVVSIANGGRRTDEQGADL